MNLDSELYNALNQHTGYIFGGLINGFTVKTQTGGIADQEARVILNIKAVITKQQNFDDNPSPR